jgi:nitroimidazol reductase NimA-like FMN-containing flavoprotein (pyridoxamine 5'-phosphate oxidase superfamily)
MTDRNDPEAIAREIIDANLYMVLATADDAGRPWATPVYYAPSAYREFFWVSSPDARHSRNLNAGRQVGIVIFDSTVPIYTGQAVYVSAVARELGGEERAAGIALFSRRSLEHDGPEWTVSDVQPPAEVRLYRASAVELYVLGEGDRRLPVEL